MNCLHLKGQCHEMNNLFESLKNQISRYLLSVADLILKTIGAYI
jgi:hypothetical protein